MRCYYTRAIEKQETVMRVNSHPPSSPKSLASKKGVGHRLISLKLDMVGRVRVPSRDVRVPNVSAEDELNERSKEEEKRCKSAPSRLVLYAEVVG